MCASSNSLRLGSARFLRCLLNFSRSSRGLVAVAPTYPSGIRSHLGRRPGFVMMLLLLPTLDSAQLVLCVSAYRPPATLLVWLNGRWEFKFKISRRRRPVLLGAAKRRPRKGLRRAHPATSSRRAQLVPKAGRRCLRKPASSEEPAHSASELAHYKQLIGKHALVNAV